MFEGTVPELSLRCAVVSFGNVGSEYEYYTLPEWTVDDFIASWGGASAAAVGSVARL
eukprot:COSAG04_NODE_3328_length_2926_cov_21.296198_4_plen_57_part_00